jgi:hypothetical protein
MFGTLIVCSSTEFSNISSLLHLGNTKLTELQQFILRFNKIVFTLWIPLKEGIGDEMKGGPKTG